MFVSKKIVIIIVTLALITVSAANNINKKEGLKASSVSSSFAYYKSPGASPTGLTWQWGSSAYLWNADSDTDKIYKLVPADGNDVYDFESPGSNPTGLAWDGTYLWNADEGTDTIYKINVINGSIQQSFNAPGSNPTGLAYDGSFLWIADNDHDVIYKVNPSDEIVVDYFDSPGPNPTGLAWDGTYLWNADYDDNLIYLIDPIEGDTVYAIDSMYGGPWGLAWHANELYNADDTWHRIYTINTNFTEENQPPVANFSWHPKNPEPGDWVFFNASNSTDPDGNITSYGWDFNNDGIYEINNNMTPIPKQWNHPGSYPVTLLVIDNQSFMDKNTKTITIQEEHPPVVDITSPEENDRVNGSVLIRGTASDTDGTISKVEVRIDEEGLWKTAIGTEEWSHVWHTKLLSVSDGYHTIFARSFNGVSYSNLSVTQVIVDNHKPVFTVQQVQGFGTIQIFIKNIGDLNAENVSCSISVFGGFFGLIHASTETTIPLIEVGEIQIVEVDRPVFGLGPLDITIIIQADTTEESTIKTNAFLLGPLIF